MTLQLTRKHSFDLVYDSQKIFRLVLHAISNPASFVSIKEYADKLYGDAPEFMALAMTLLDNEVSFNTCKDHRLSEEITLLTHAGREGAEHADFIFVRNLSDLKNAIVKAKSGTLADPHKSATFIIRNDGEPVYRLTLSGPGIDGRTAISASQTVKDAIELRDAQNYEYPQGIDLLFISHAGEMFAVPRLTRMEVH